MKYTYIIIPIIIINIITFLVYGEDKRRARKNKWRIPEKTLLLLALLGGAPGALAGMQVFRHKARKNLFRIGVPCILVLQIVGAVVVWGDGGAFQ